MLKCLLLLLVGAWQLHAYNLTTFPVAFTEHNRIMSFILSFSYDHIDPLLLILNEYVSMCEGGWDPTVMIFTTSNWTDTMFRYTRQRTYCYRTGKSIPIRLSVHDASVGTGLSMMHKPVLQKEIDNFDFFVYHEDDIIFKFSHLSAYLYETRKLAEVVDPANGLHGSVIGFQRFRRILRGDLSAKFTENDIIDQEMMEETPTFTPICYNDVPYIMVTKNTHQAIWAFTTIQLRILQEKCHFLEHMQPSREFMSSFLVFEHRPAYCAMSKIIPADRLMTFSIWHYYHQRHVSWSSLFGVDENIRAGYAPYNPSPKLDAYIPSCWEKFSAEAKREMGMPPLAPPAPAAPAN